MAEACDSNVCVVCNKEFRSVSNRNKHMRRIHGATVELITPFRTFSCPLCFVAFEANSFLINHFESDHGYTVEKEFLEFSDVAAFLRWKDEVEKEHNVSFCKKSGTKDLKGAKTDYFYCYRSGEYKENECRKRRLKTLGSNKINGVCPARIKVAYADDIIKVTFIKTHIGHDHNTRRLRLTYYEKQNIAELLNLNLPIDDIIDIVRNADFDLRDRVRYLNRNDILNIRKEFNVDYKPALKNSQYFAHCDDMYLCSLCKKTCKSKSGLLNHQRTIHSAEYKDMRNSRKLLCVLCSDVFTSKVVILKHFINDHGRSMEKELLEFPNEEEFMKWKNDMEKSNFASFKHKWRMDIKKALKTLYLYCIGNDKMLESIKYSDSSLELDNIICVCPAVIKATYNEDTISVECTKTHIGHGIDDIKLNLKHIETQNINNVENINDVEDDTSADASNEDNSNLSYEQPDSVNEIEKTEVVNTTETINNSDIVCNDNSNEPFAVNESGNLCIVCGKQFHNNSNLYRHQRLKHGGTTEYFRNRTLVCPLCELTFVSKTTLENHLIADHGYVIEKELLQFSSKIKFLQWKKQIEKDSSVSFCKNSGLKKIKGVGTDYFYCYRSGEYKDSEYRKRRLKALGSNKINGICPAMMKVTYTDEMIKVIFTKTHIGHDVDIRRLRLSQDEREYIAKQLADGKSVDTILEEARKSSLEGESRLSLISRKDIINIKKGINIDNSGKIKKNPFTCVVCDKEFKTVCGLNRHLKQVHGAAFELNQNRTLLCPLCSASFAIKSDLDRHFETDHGYSIEKECLEFSDKVTFFRWKGDIEDENNVYFRKRSGAKNVKGIETCYYYCSKTFEFRDTECQKKVLNALRSNKMNGMCPAMMVVTCIDDVVKVNYTKTHIGHDITIRRPYLLQEDKEYIVNQLASGKSIDSVLEELKMLFCENKNNLNYLNRDTILKIMEEFKINNNTSKTVSSCDNQRSVYTCKICEKKFKSSSTLAQHRKVHSMAEKFLNNERSFHCPLCSVTFTSENKLQNHLEANHEYNLEAECIVNADEGYEIEASYVSENEGRIELNDANVVHIYVTDMPDSEEATSVVYYVPEDTILVHNTDYTDETEIAVNTIISS